jgi:hypothetical protein
MEPDPIKYQQNIPAAGQHCHLRYGTTVKVGRFKVLDDPRINQVWTELKVV